MMRAWRNNRFACRRVFAYLLTHTGSKTDGDCTLFRKGKPVVTRLALVVEDDDQIAQFVAIVLREVGFEVDMAGSGRAALDAINAQPPDMIVLDLNIPQMSGVDVLRYIRAVDGIAHIPVIVVSANPHMVAEIDDLADVVLLKPMSYDQLRGMVQRFA